MKKLLIPIYMILLLGLSQVAAAQHSTSAMGVTATAGDKAQMTEEDKVLYLINYLRNLPGATFIRNGDEYTPGKAADHLQSKWEKHKKRVKTAHEFVTKLATFSKTKEPYQIRFSDGNTVKCGDLLNEELNKIEI